MQPYTTLSTSFAAPCTPAACCRQPPPPSFLVCPHFCHGDDFYAALVFAPSSYSSSAVFPRTNSPGYNLIAMIPACRSSVRQRPITIQLVSVSTHAAHMWSVRDRTATAAGSGHSGRQLQGGGKKLARRSLSSHLGRYAK